MPRLSADALAAALRARAPRDACGLGARVIVLPRCPSTQDEARALALAGAPHGTLVVAHAQDAGRGRRGRAWLSGEGGLYLSMVLRPRMAPEHLPRIPLLCAVAVAEALWEMGVPAALKWPNDIVVPADPPGPLGPYRKLAGVLAEPSLVGPQVEFVILGLGLNVQTPAGGFPAELQLRATALEREGGPRDPDAALLALVPHLARWLAAPEDKECFREAHARLCDHSATLGRRVQVEEGAIQGMAEHIDDEGALWVRDDQGGRHRIWAGDVLPSPAPG